MRKKMKQYVAQGLMDAEKKNVSAPMQHFSIYCYLLFSSEVETDFGYSKK
jgi:hypothetical protein